MLHDYDQRSQNYETQSHWYRDRVMDDRHDHDADHSHDHDHDGPPPGAYGPPPGPPPPH
jgi:hypothetical protein